MKRQLDGLWGRTVLIVALGVAGPAWGEISRSAHPLELSAGIGAQLGGVYTVEDFDLDADAGFISKIAADYFPIAYLGLGAYFIYSGSFNELQGDLNTIELGLSIKPRVPFEGLIGDMDLLITPGIMVGYRGLFPAEGDSADGLALNLGVELRLRFNERYGVFLEPGFLTQPTGGNDEASVTFSPIFYVLVGAAMAL